MVTKNTVHYVWVGSPWTSTWWTFPWAIHGHSNSHRCRVGGNILIGSWEHHIYIALMKWCKWNSQMHSNGSQDDCGRAMWDMVASHCLFNNPRFLWLVRLSREKTPSRLNMNAPQSFCSKMLLHCYNFVLYVKFSIVEQIGKVKMKYSLK